MDDKEQARFDRLPQWAQRRIKGLEASVSIEKARTKAATEAANGVLSASGACVWLNPYDTVPTPVAPVGEGVRFMLSPDGTLNSWDFVDVRVTRDRNTLEIQAGRGVVISPRASNTVTIELRKH